MVAVLTLLGVNGHHAILRALAASYEALPIGGGGRRRVAGRRRVRDILALVFVVGVRLAAPIVIVLLVVEMAVGLISRAAPALSFMVIGYPIRLVVGLFVLGMVVRAVPGVVERPDRTTPSGSRMDTASAFR